MMQDTVRTGTYQNAFLTHNIDFRDKVVLDVGTGSGILAFFAVQAGARLVYAAEASGMAKHAATLVKENGLEGRIIVVNKVVEEMELPEKVDIIISEPIGFLLVHERMLETYIVARDKWLKPGGLMFPNAGEIAMCPFTDEALYNEQLAKTVFWSTSTDFYGVNLTSLTEAAQAEFFAQPVVGYFYPSCLLSPSAPVRHRVDFMTVTCEELKRFEVPFSFVAERTAIMHGMGCWFDIEFAGSGKSGAGPVVLSTSPAAPGTHWYQCRLLLPEPIAINRGQRVSGSLQFEANDQYSYDLVLSARLKGTGIECTSTIYLQDQSYHYLNHTVAPVVPVVPATVGGGGEVLVAGLGGAGVGAVVGGGGGGGGGGGWSAAMNTTG
jgi:histone-arginine methyltransferase CARM1